MSAKKALEYFNFDINEFLYDSDKVKYHTVTNDKLLFSHPVKYSKLDTIEGLNWVDKGNKQRIVVGFENLKNGFSNNNGILFFEDYDSEAKVWNISSSVLNNELSYAVLVEFFNEDDELPEIIFYLDNYFNNN